MSTKGESGDEKDDIQPASSNTIHKTNEVEAERKQPDDRQNLERDSRTDFVRDATSRVVERSLSSSPEAYTLPTPRCPLFTPPFKRIDFDDMTDAAIEDRKPAWKQLEESIKSSYHNARKTAERSKEELAFMDSQLQRHSRRRSSSPFEELSNRSLALRLSGGTLAERDVYAAPAVSSSQGIESQHEARANKIEASLLRASILPEHMKTITTKEFRSGPTPSVGSASEAYADEVDYQSFLPRPYYSRPNRDDPDYFDFDLPHSINMYRRPEGKYVPSGPQNWEQKVIQEVKAKGEAPVSGYIFTKGSDDWRRQGTSYLSAALRTPAFWEQRFTSIGKEVRDRNPVSLESIARNKPVPSRWTEYRDPDFEDLSDLDD